MPKPSKKPPAAVAPEPVPPLPPVTEVKPKTPRKPREPKVKPPSRFIDQRKIAAELGVCTKQIRRWIDKAEWRMPAIFQGTLLLWRRTDYEHFLKTRCWPRGLEFRHKY